MAAQLAPNNNQPPPHERVAEPEVLGYNTRNENLRPLYNPDPIPPQKKQKKKQSKPSAAAGKPQDAIDVNNEDVPLPASSVRSPSVRHYHDVNNMPRTAQGDANLAMNDWTINQAAKTFPTLSAHNLPMSVADIPKDPSLEAQVQQVLLNTASHLAKGNQNNGFYPHKYAVRGLEQKKLGLNSMTILKYLHGILRMIKDNTVPSNVKPYIYAHLEEIIKDAREYDWATAVRPWSEQVFTVIAEGRLPEGWGSQNKIQMLRMTVSRASTASLTPSQPQPY